jgi:Domain of unknown function (DUF4232)
VSLRRKRIIRWSIYTVVCLALTVATVGALVVTATSGGSAGAGLPSRCLTRALAATVGQADVAMGHVGQVVHLRDRSSSRCTLRGYPRLRMLDASGRAMPTEVRRGSAYTVPHVRLRQVALRPGGEASFDAGFEDRTGFGTRHCPTSARVAITPPGDSTALTVVWRIAPYGGDIPHLRCGEITVSPVFAAGAR